MQICWPVFLVVQIFICYCLLNVLYYIFRKNVRCCWQSAEDIGKWEGRCMNFDYEQFFYTAFGR